MDKFLLVLFSILLCVLAMVYFKNVCHAMVFFTSALILTPIQQPIQQSIQQSIQQPIQQLVTYGGACHDKHKYSQDIVVDGLNAYNCLRDFLTAQGINKNPLKTTNPHILYFALIRSMLIATTGMIHFVAKDDTVLYDVMMNILYKKSSIADKYPGLKIPNYLLPRIKFYYATYTAEGRSILQKAKSELEIAKTDIESVRLLYKKDYIAVDEISKKIKHSRYTKEQKICFRAQMAAITIRKDKIYRNINEKTTINKLLDNFIDKYENEHALRGIDDNLALYTLSKLVKTQPNIYYVSNDMLSEMPRKLHPSNYMYKVFTNDIYAESYTTMDVEKNLQAVTAIVEKTELLSKCMFTIDAKNNDICLLLYRPGGEDGKSIISVAQKDVVPKLYSDVLEVCEELTTLYILLQLYLKTKSDNDVKIILQHINTDDLCAEYGQKITSYDSIKELIIESKENLIDVSEIKTSLNKLLLIDPCTTNDISYLRTDITYDMKILSAIKYLINANTLLLYDRANYISRIKYISNKAVKSLVPNITESSITELSITEPIIT